MQIKMTVAVLLSCGLIFFSEISAQENPDVTKTIPGDVTFEVPLKLTRLSPYLTKMAVTCMIAPNIDIRLLIDPRLNPNIGTTNRDNTVLSKSMEFSVSAGQVDGTLQVVIAVPTTSSPYKPKAVLSYQCALFGVSSDPKALSSGWTHLGGKVPGASLEVSPKPVPISGTFTW